VAVSEMTADLSWLRRRQGRPPVVVAHRGASGLAPENTLAAFRLAVEQGAPCVECDVHLTADGVPIVIHDATVDRTTNGSGAVSAMRFEDLRRLDAGAWRGGEFTGERLPTLDETLAACAGRARLVVELKAGGGEALVDAALAAIDAAAGTDVAVISFGPDEVRLTARKRPDLPLGFLITKGHLTQHGVPAALAAARDFGATFFSPNEAPVDAALVDAAHAVGLPVSVWTVDDPARMAALASLGVDAITTNRPDVALGLFR
jgi:glycerophosphoryl diester phosphodiesterase